MIIDDWWLIIDCLHTENTEGYGCPQADEGGERKLKRINRELKEMGPQADGGEQVSINDERLLIVDYWLLMTDDWWLIVFTRKMRRTRIIPKSGRANL